VHDRRIRVLTSIALAAILLSQLCAFGDKKSNLNARLGHVKQTKKALQYKIHLKKEQERTELGKLAIVQSKLEDAQDKLTTNKIKLQDAKADLAVTTKHLNMKKRELARHQELLRRRVVEIYEGDDLSYADVVLGSSDMWTFLTRAYYLQRIVNADTVLIDQINEAKKSIEADKAQQARRVAEIDSRMSQLVGERDAVQSATREKERQVGAIENDKVAMERALAEMEAEEHRIEDQILRLQSTPAGLKRAAKVFHGTFMLPVSGRCTCRFGYRIHPVTHKPGFHTGMDIGVPAGTPVHAAADGTVVKAGYNSAYGYMVVIEHDGGYSTLYGHNSRMLVSVGDNVKQGEVIAKSGSTGLSTGPHVHYQLMKMGKPINPGG
jgi:peptidoglycan DL-endopeptidase CwlO